MRALQGDNGGLSSLVVMDLETAYSSGVNVYFKSLNKLRKLTIKKVVEILMKNNNNCEQI